MDNYTSDSSDCEYQEKTLDYAYLLLEPETIQNNLQEVIDTRKKHLQIESLILHHNQLSQIPDNVFHFSNLKFLDVSSNGLRTLPDISSFCPISTLVAKNNLLNNDSLPKCFSDNAVIRELNLSGNLFTQFPEQVLDLANLRFLYLGGNSITTISRKIHRLKHIQILSMGGNQLSEVPCTVGELKNLQILVLCDNKIETLPANIANLNNLKSLQLHKNKLKALPPEILALKNLTELSLRENPLVVRFVSDMSYNAPSLLELSARTINLHNFKIKPGDVPRSLDAYLNSGHRCVNPDCKGVYFDNRVEHIKFVDFCGKYRIPLLQYLCSSKCMAGPKETWERPPKSYLMKKVLLG